MQRGQLRENIRVSVVGLALAALLVGCAGGNGSGTSTTTATDQTTTTGSGGTTTTSGEQVDALDLTNQAVYDQILADARAEGGLTWYTVNASETADRIGALFEEEFGIPVTIYRAGGGEVLQRFLLEAESDRIQSDVVSFGSDGAATTELAQDGHFVCDYTLRAREALYSWAIDPDGCWYAERAAVSLMAYRTDLLADLNVEAPTSWTDLANPALSGRVYTAHPAFSATNKMANALLVDVLGEEWLTSLRDNDVVVARDQAQLLVALESGEAVIVGPGNHSRLAAAKVAGRPIELVMPSEGSFIGVTSNMIPVKAPHPNAALIFADFLFSEAAQQIFLDAGNIAALTSLPEPEGLPPLADAVVFDVDWPWMIENAEPAVETFSRILGEAQE